MGRGDSKAALTIRVIVGAYLLYIDYQIFGDVMAREGVSRYVMLAIMAVFAVVGVLLIIMSIRSLAGGDYDEAGYSGPQEDEEQTVPDPHVETGDDTETFKR